MYVIPVAFRSSKIYSREINIEYTQIDRKDCTQCLRNTPLIQTEKFRHFAIEMGYDMNELITYITSCKLVSLVNI